MPGAKVVTTAGVTLAEWDGCRSGANGGGAATTAGTESTCK